MDMIVKTEYQGIRPYTTKDGSLIRELMHPNLNGNSQQSLAEALIPPDSATLLHRHGKSEEIYHITQGTGFMTLGDETFPVTTGDTVCILPNTPHLIHNTGKIPLKLLCCSVPPYSHEDTLL
jgi:mannose-6-phosphate isomerase-like protein (cupin superfamily)